MALRLTAMPMPLATRSRFSAWRDRVLTNPRFLSWAAAFPVTRWIARRRADALFDLCAGFVYSQILYACVKLGLFDILREGPRELGALARWLGLSQEATERMLGAATSLRLVEKRGPSLYGLGPLGAAIAANPGIAAMVEHHAHLYADLADPVRLLRGEKGSTALGAYWPYAEASEPAALSAEAVADYSRLMALSQPLVAEEVLDAYPFHRHRRILDIGGGEGAFLAAVATRAPNLELVLFDLPAVAERATARFAREGLGARTSVAGGDFFNDSLPAGADIVTLIRVLLDHDDASALKILQAARQAIGPDGTLLIAEPVAETGSEAMAGAYFGFYLMAMGRGRPRSVLELSRLLEQAGFDRIGFRTGRRVLRTGILTAKPVPDC